MDATDARPARDTLKLTLVVALVLAFVLVLRSWLRAWLGDSGMPDPVAKDLSYLVVPPLLAVLLMPIARDAFGGLAARLRIRGLTWRTVFLAVALGTSLRLVHWGALLGGVSFRFIVNPDPGAPAGPFLAFACPPPALVLLNLFVMALLTPLVEEIVHRAGFLQWFLTFGRRFAIVGSALVFAAFHRPDAMPYALLFGLFAGVLYVNSGSLWGPLIAHATANGLIVLDWLCLKGTWNPAEVTDRTIGVGLLATALAASALVSSALLVSRRIAGPAPDDPPDQAHSA